ncbi:MAG: hemolysin family protein [Spirochaetaceae bacterium]|jgi:putative hemolysin|nr:hemolysin family protein [Spirochaetaceae bacterium]
MRLLLPVVCLAVLVALSAFFSSSETAFLSLSRVALRGMQKQNDLRGRRVAEMRANLNSLLTTILIGNNLVNNLASGIATGIAVDIAPGGSDGGAMAATLATVVMTFVIVLFGEILPKTIAVYHASRIARQNSALLQGFRIVLRPFAAVFSVVTNGVASLAARIPRQQLVTGEELQALIELGSQEGTLESREKELLNRIFRFQDLRAEQIMRHRSTVHAVPAGADRRQIITAFTQSGYSQLPVYDGAPDNYVGLLDFRDILLSRDIEPRALHFIPGTMTAASLLQLFKAGDFHFAVVVDEHGSNLGIVTLNDVLDSVLGRLVGAQSKAVRALGDSSFTVPGSLTLTECNELFGLHLTSEFFTTLGGWLLERFDALPEAGQILHHRDCAFTIETLSDQRITTVRVDRDSAPAASAD